MPPLRTKSGSYFVEANDLFLGQLVTIQRTGQQPHVGPADFDLYLARWDLSGRGRCVSHWTRMRDASATVNLDHARSISIAAAAELLRNRADWFGLLVFAQELVDLLVNRFGLLDDEAVLGGAKHAASTADVPGCG